MVIDTRSGRILHSAETDNDLKSRHPYKEWMEKTSAVWCRSKTCRKKKSAAVSWMMTRSPATRNSLTTALKSWTPSCASLGKTAEAVGSMGDDTPFAVLSSQPRIIYDYFRQQFAQ